MDITDARLDPLPAAGKLRFVNDGGLARVLDSNGRRARVRPEAGTPVNGVAAALSTNLSNATNNDLTFTAVTAGVSGNSISVQYAISGTGSAVLSVGVTGASILVTAGSATTAASVKTAIEASAAASALVTVANKSANDGLGVIAALAATNLSGGVDATPAIAGDVLFDATNIYFALADVKVSSASGWKKVAHASL